MKRVPNRTESEIFKITGEDGVGKATIYAIFLRDENGALVDCRLVPKSKSGTVFEDLMLAVSDRIGKEIRK